MPKTVVLKPLPGLPVIRDLVVDMTQFSRQYHSIKPWLVNNDPPPERERLQSPEARDELNGLYECILCACFSSAAPPSASTARRPAAPAPPPPFDASRRRKSRIEAMNFLQ